LSWSILSAAVAMTPARSSAQAVAVTWTSVTNATVSDGTLTKTGGCDGCSDAGAMSSQAIASGDDGYLRFTLTDAASLRYVGFNNGEAVNGYEHFAWRIQDNSAEVREDDQYRTDVSVAANDVLKIAVESGVIKYYKNDALIHASSVAPSYPLVANASLLEAGASVAGAMIDTGAGSSGAPCGLEDDTAIYTPASYETFSRPAKGASYTDAVFGCSVKRLTNGVSDFGGPAHHEYSSMSPFNSDNTRLLLATCCAFYVTDLAGNVVVSTTALAIGSSQEPRWSQSNPSLLYYHDGNALKSYNVATSSRSTVATFGAYSAISFGGGEADISDDGDYIVVIGDPGTSNARIHTYRFSTATLSASSLAVAGAPLDWCDMTPNNNVLCMWTASGTSRYQGVELFNSSLGFQRQVLPFFGHADRGRDSNGDEIMTIIASNDPAPATGCGGNGVEKVRLSDSAKTCLLPLYWGESTHMSINGPHGYVLVSNVDSNSGGTAASPAPSGWASQWGTYYNELDLVALDGSHVWRLAHHRSRTRDSYWHLPRAALSRDGQYVLFDSNFNQLPVSDYTDVYLIDAR
jgi:hypothetical protein